MKSIFPLAAIAALGICAASCSNDNKWHIDGNISGLADTDALVLEGNNQGYWYLMDTIRPNDDGSFSYAREAQGYPDIYRLRVADKTIYFPIDSIETVTITASMPDIAATHTLSGTPQAETLARVDSLLAASASASGASAVVNDQALKRRLGQMLIADPAGIVTYYIISKTIDGRPLFNAADKTDRRYIGAVANAFSEFRPTDPRTNYLKNLFISHRRAAAAASNQAQGTAAIQANVVGAFDIRLYDNKGVEHSLLDLAGKGKVTLLSFTAYTADWSPALNVELNRIYQKYKDRGLEIYQVSLDDNEYAWKEAAKNLPWITVLNDISNGGQTLRDYNVTSLPTAFIIDRDGELVSRINSPEQLEASVARYF